MERIIKGDPAPYPNTNSPEIKAVIKFVTIIDIDRVKPDVKFLDKVPNTDGLLEIVNTSQIPIGKIEVQIKSLDKKNTDTPKYQCKTDFLAACELSILPVLLILVDDENSVAYWHHMDRSTIVELSKKMKKKSVNLDFDKNNSIKKGQNHYVDKWTRIIEGYQEKLFDYEQIKKRSEELDLELSALKDVTNIAIGKTNDIFKEVHIFLDFYNGLLDREFLTIKNILYPNFWKIGVGIYEYSNYSLSFSLYPILYSLNDVLIKQYRPDDHFYLQNVLNYIGHNTENPIKTRPRKYSFELIERDTMKVLENQQFLVKDQFIANEYILAFIDEYYPLLGLDVKTAEYSIADIEFSLGTFLPLYLEKTIGKKIATAIEIDFIFHHTYPEEIQKMADEVKEYVSRGEKPTAKFEIVSTKFSVPILFNLIAHLRLMGVEIVTREYETKHEVGKSSYYTWEAWGEEKTVKNVRVFYSHFIRIYNLLVQTYFPDIKSELQFYQDFNLLIIVVDFSRSASDYVHMPSIERYYLKTHSDTENEVIVYNANDDQIPVKKENVRDYFTSGVLIKGKGYRLKNCSFSILSFIYEQTPVLTSINELLKENLKKYFTKIKTMS